MRLSPCSHYCEHCLATLANTWNKTHIINGHFRVSAVTQPRHAHEATKHRPSRVCTACHGGPTGAPSTASTSALGSTHRSNSLIHSRVLVLCFVPAYVFVFSRLSLGRHALSSHICRLSDSHRNLLTGLAITIPPVGTPEASVQDVLDGPMPGGQP